MAYDREDEGAPEDIRFKSERLAIKERLLCFDYFVDNNPLDGEDGIKTLDALRETAYKARDEQDPWIRAWVLRQTLTNYFTLLAIARQLQWDGRLWGHRDVGSLLRHFREVLKQGEDTHDLSRSDDPWAYLICEVWEAGRESGDKAQAPAKSAWAGIRAWPDAGPAYALGRLELVKGMLISYGLPEPAPEAEPEPLL